MFSIARRLTDSVSRFVSEDAGGWGLTLKNLFLPIFCKQCGVRLLTEENGFFCPDCWESSPKIERPFCIKCGRPHERMVGLGERSNFPCAECRDRPNPHIRQIVAPALYASVVETAIKLLKFNGRERLAGPLAEWMRETALQELNPDEYDLVTPVPLHKVRRRERGFNQSELLARGVLPIFPNARLDMSLSRIRPTRTQSRLTGPERGTNVRGAFAVIGPDLGNAKVLLVDDVVTTSETVTECAAALRRAGAYRVDVLAAALASRRGLGVDNL
jgi:competence protein ComFC